MNFQKNELDLKKYTLKKIFLKDVFDWIIIYMILVIMHFSKTYPKYSCSTNQKAKQNTSKMLSLC